MLPLHGVQVEFEPYLSTTEKSESFSVNFVIQILPIVLVNLLDYIPY